MDDLKLTIMERMKTIRTVKQLNLDQASEMTGISKAMLSQIERGQSMPTITTLWKISTGYKVPLTYFLEKASSDNTVTDITDMEPVYEEDKKMRTYTLVPYNPAQNFEMLYIEFDPHCVHRSSKHISGVEEYIFVQSGQLELELNAETVKIIEKQCFRFRADVAHGYINTSERVCGIINLIVYPLVMPVDR
ncbi:HTH-type transcriptional regulator SutR [bioreactor metagenome]|uniref:HTH-type transcriptional regulator SutR n=1 Tax=bioreactor metagenome TaxID=1076179 RepID=A0A645C6H3_9ZZZZ